MMLAPIPDDDAKRVAALRSLGQLDTPPEERFDRISRMALRLFDVPMAYVSLVDANRQWFKSSCGLTAKETARDISFCGHAILSPTTLIIPNALEDARFADNPLVTGDPFIRMYAGHPLRTPDGSAVGTFCIADRKAREMDESDRRVLIELASIVQDELQLFDRIRLQNEMLDLQKKLISSRERMAKEVGEAAEYVKSRIPPPCGGRIPADWRYLPAHDLGGDSLGFHWIDDRHFALYLLDVCGHGIGAALLSVSALNLIRSHSLPHTDVRQPEQVMKTLNQIFAMSDHDGRFFTLWYGVYDTETRELRYASAGHPPALLITSGGGSRRVVELGTGNPPVGAYPELVPTQDSVTVPSDARLVVYSDGAYEIESPDGARYGISEFKEFMAGRSAQAASDLDAIVERLKTLNADDELDDDFSLIEARFPATP